MPTSTTETTDTTDRVAPVHHRIEVPLAPAQAFELFTAGIARWWPMASHSCSAERDARVVFEPFIGGRVIETASDGREHTWGTLTAWQPPGHFAMTWHPGRPDAEATHLDVRFHAIDGGCAIELAHDGWSQRGDAAEAREGYARGWPRVLAELERIAKETA